MSNISTRSIRFTTLSLLIALLFILTFTPLGFIAIPPVSITILHIPVIIGSILLGPLYGGILGLTFGLLSIFKATTSAVSPVDMMFSPFISGAPFASLILALVPRILLGVLPSLINQFLRRFINKISLTTAISAGIGAFCHAFLVYAFLALFFSVLPFKQIIFTVLSLNGGLGIIVAVITVPLITIPLNKFLLSSNSPLSMIRTN